VYHALRVRRNSSIRIEADEPVAKVFRCGATKLGALKDTQIAGAGPRGCGR